MFTSRIRDAVLDLVYPHLSAGSIWSTEVVDSLAGLQLEGKWVEGQKVKWQQKGQQCHKFSCQLSAHFKHVYRIPAGLKGIKDLFHLMTCKSMHNFYVRWFFFWMFLARKWTDGPAFFTSEQTSLKFTMGSKNYFPPLYVPTLTWSQSLSSDRKNNIMDGVALP